MAVVDSQPACTGSFAAADAELLVAGLDAILDTLTTATGLLADLTRAETSYQPAVVVLRSVENDLLSLACASTTASGPAAALVQVRDDLSASLLAALLVDEAAPTISSAAAILRQATAAAIAGLGTVRVV
jgi:hypothetical protein